MKKTLIILIILFPIAFSLFAQEKDDHNSQSQNKYSLLKNTTNKTINQTPEIKTKLTTQEIKVIKSLPYSQFSNNFFNLVDNWKKEVTKKIIDKLNLPALPYLMASYDWKNQRIYNIKIGVTKTFNNALLGAEYHFDSGTASVYLKMSFSTSK